MNNAVHILIIDTSPVLGGAELYALELAGNINKDKYKIHFALAEPLFEQDDGCSYSIFKSRRLKSFNIFSSLYNLVVSIADLLGTIRAINPDIIQTNNVRAHLLGTVAALILRKKLVWVNHSYDFPKILFRLFSFAPDRIVYVSRKLRKDYSSILIRKSKEKVIHNGIDFNKIDNYEGDFIERRYRLSRECNRIGIMGRIEQSKGQEYLIKSIPIVLSEHPNSKFFIIGDVGPNGKEYHEYLLRIVRQLSIEKSVVFTGYLRNKYEIINALDIMVQIAIEPESFGRTIIESMAIGKPVIATKIGGFVELIRDGIDGILIPPRDHVVLANAILRLIKEKGLASKMGMNGREKAMNEYSLSIAIKDFSSLYDEVGHICTK